MNRILLEPAEINADGIALLTGRRARHALAVLGAKPGRRLRVGVVNGPVGSAMVEAIGSDEIRLRCALEATAQPEPDPLDLLLALPRPKVMKRLWAPLASLGVRRILLANAARVEKSYFATHWLAPSTYRPLLIEGLEQSGDTRLPEVTIFRRFRPLVEDEITARYAGAVLLAADPCAERRVMDIAPLPRDRPVLAAVGPEGGWTAFERDRLAAAGFLTVTLGRRVLRSDVAAMALTVLIAEARCVKGCYHSSEKGS